MARIDRHARDYALIAHHGQRYGTGPLPFASHLIDVNDVLVSFHIIDPVLLATGWLHDILEDTPTTRTQLLENFPENIVRLVELVTDEPGQNRAERKTRTYPKTATDQNAVVVKLADRIANIRRTVEFKHSKERFRMEYLKEYPEFRAVLYKKELHPDSNVGTMWSYLDHLMETLRACQEGK